MNAKWTPFICNERERERAFMTNERERERERGPMNVNVNANVTFSWTTHALLHCDKSRKIPGFEPLCITDRPGPNRKA